MSDLRVIGLDSSVPDGDHGELDDDQLDWLSRELRQPAPAGTILVIHHPPPGRRPRCRSSSPCEPRAPWGAAIRGSDVRLILSDHTHRVSAGTLADVPVWVSPRPRAMPTRSPPAVSAATPAGAYTRIDVPNDGAIVSTFIPLTGRDEILYDVAVEDAGP